MSDMWIPLKDADCPVPNIARILLENEQQKLEIIELQASITQKNNKQSPDQANPEFLRLSPSQTVLLSPSHILTRSSRGVILS